MQHRQFSDQVLLQDHNEKEFEEIALGLFHLHVEQNPIYGAFCKALRVHPTSVKEIKQIPFLPISFFKTHTVLLKKLQKGKYFESSGTSSSETSRHYLADTELYKKSILNGFKRVFGNPSDYVFLALLPSYLEREHSSLVYMTSLLMEASGKSENNWFLYNHQSLFSVLNHLKKEREKTILLGVSFALLDFVTEYLIDFPELIVVETGGMKGRRREIVRDELHAEICKGFGVKKVYSEYGMTELLSQAWSIADGKFKCPLWMKILIRDNDDPLTIYDLEKTGGINIIDFANRDSCPFVATDDLGRILPDGTFEVLGRFDGASVRGCNTMYK